MKKRIIIAIALGILLAFTSAGCLSGAPPISAQTTDFLELVSNGTPQQIQAAIKQGADVKARGSGGWTALMQAARYNPNTEVIAILLGAGADINAHNKLGKTPLILAVCYNKNPEVITTLLKAGADVNAGDRDIAGQTPLMYAASNKNTDVITTLLEAGADINARDDEGHTALNYAQDPKVRAILLKAGGKEGVSLWQEERKKVPGAHY